MIFFIIQTKIICTQLTIRIWLIIFSICKPISFIQRMIQLIDLLLLFVEFFCQIWGEISDFVVNYNVTRKKSYETSFQFSLFWRGCLWKNSFSVYFYFSKWIFCVLQKSPQWRNTYQKFFRKILLVSFQVNQFLIQISLFGQFLWRKKQMLFLLQ